MIKSIFYYSFQLKVFTDYVLYDGDECGREQKFLDSNNGKHLL